MSLREVLIDELRDLYSAENQQIKAMPKVIRNVESEELKQVFSQHFDESKEHVVRLRQAFEALGKKPTGKHCTGMEGAIAEVKEALEEDAEGASYDAGLIGAAARVEHYEIAGYTVACAIAKQLREPELLSLLEQTLNQERSAAKLLMIAAKTVLKQALAEEGDEEEPETKPKTGKEKRSAKKSQQEEEEAAEVLVEAEQEALPAKRGRRK